MAVIYFYIANGITAKFETCVRKTAVRAEYSSEGCGDEKAERGYLSEKNKQEKRPDEQAGIHAFNGCACGQSERKPNLRL